ncbi:hypothetical protein HGRIS_002334 [Hohenbuehelia grisea]|uniref:Uncharacterized protein n=1 Tax=Hohenbuehelia grisea TaxID=104357 RepID=A0ABR3JK68_9AGAR
MVLTIAPRALSFTTATTDSDLQLQPPVALSNFLFGICPLYHLPSAMHLFSESDRMIPPHRTASLNNIALNYQERPDLMFNSQVIPRQIQLLSLFLPQLALTWHS